jgi:hypothetical protein
MKQKTYYAVAPVVEWGNPKKKLKWLVPLSNQKIWGDDKNNYIRLYSSKKELLSEDHPLKAEDGDVYCDGTVVYYKIVQVKWEIIL